ncbi:hypothetical protein LXL04_015839 [Taraxacum kok-saghyz]
MKITDSNLKNSASDLAAQNRENHFSFERMVKLVPVSQGNPIRKAELIDKTQFQSTPYTDSINCVSNLIRKFEQPILNIADPVLGDSKSEKPMELDTGVESDQNKQQIYGSILDLNPNYSISALVAKFNKDIKLFCQWGDSDELHAYWNGLSYADKEKLLLGLLMTSRAFGTQSMESTATGYPPRPRLIPA